MKLLTKMGYNHKGLGNYSHGIVNTIEVRAQPRHEGLDYIQKEVKNCSKNAKSRSSSSVKFVKKELVQAEGESCHDENE